MWYGLNNPPGRWLSDGRDYLMCPAGHHRPQMVGNKCATCAQVWMIEIHRANITPLPPVPQKKSVEDARRISVLKDRLRQRLSKAIRGRYKSGSAVRDLGCSIEEFMEYIAAKFQPGMGWDNYGSWHLDHIKPLYLFDLSDKNQLRLAVHYSNLQPLWAIDNSSKQHKYSGQSPVPTDGT